jgi:triphosphatase
MCPSSTVSTTDSVVPERLSDRPESLQPCLSLDQALAAILGAALAPCATLLPVVLPAGEGEAIHQSRVALRRLRAALWLIRRIAPDGRAAIWSDAAKRLADRLGPVRDWDVLLGRTLPAARSLCPDLEGFEDLTGAVTEHRRRAWEAARVGLEGDGVHDLLGALAEWGRGHGWREGLDTAHLVQLDRPVEAFARPVLRRLRRRVLKAGRHFAGLTPEHRHRVRIALKKLRYAAEFLAPALDAPSALHGYARHLERLQDAFGLCNDDIRTGELLRRVELGPMASAAHIALGAVLGQRAALAAGIERDLVAEWRAFRKSRSPWR